MATLCYFCDERAVGWIDWVVHDGGKLASLVSVIGVCQDHADMILDTLADLAVLPITDEVS